MEALGEREHGPSPELTLGRSYDGRSSPMTCKRQALSEMLDAYASTVHSKERVTFEELIGLLGNRSMAAMLLVLALPMVVPVPAPGISVAFGFPMAIIATQLALGQQQAWLPRAVARRGMPQSSFVNMLTRVLPFLRRIEKLVRPRFSWLVGRWSAAPIGLVCLALALIIALPIPLGHFVPGTAIVLLSLGLLERDGLAVGLGMVAALLGVTLVTLASVGVIRAVLP